MRYLVVAALLCGIALAYVPGSFRWQSTAGLFEDDYDLIFEPARIPLIEGSRVYTSLSNLVSSREELFGGSSEDFYLVGGSTDRLGWFCPALLYDRFVSRRPLETGLYGPGEIPLRGTGRVVMTDYRDLDQNGTYDFLRQEIAEAEAWQEDASADYYVGAALKRDDNIRFGIGFARSESLGTYVDPDYNRAFDRRDSNLVTGHLLLIESDSFEGLDKTSSTNNRFVLGGWYDSEFLSLGVNGGFTLTGGSDSYTHTGQVLSDRSPGSELIRDRTEGSMVDTMSLPYSGMAFSGLVSAFYTPSDEIESRFYLRLFSQSQDVADAGGGLTYIRTDSLCYPGTAYASDSTFHHYTGRRATQGFSVSTDQLFNLSDQFSFGLGAGFSSRSWQDSLADTSAHRGFYSYDNGDTLMNREDYTRTTTWSSQWLDRVTGRAHTLYLPVGMEYRPWTPLAVRLGASHEISWRRTTWTEQLVASSPRRTRTEYGDGSWFESIGDAEEQPGTSETSDATVNTTRFHYGVGFSPIDNLQIDLMGFADLTDLVDWKLSVTFKF